MNWTPQHAVIATMAYADLFDYPLTKEELFYWLISNVDYRSKKQITAIANSLYTDGTYFLLQKSTRKIQQRKQRAIISQKKIALAAEVAARLSIIPTIEFIGLSGSVSMQNAAEDDDIDLFIVIRPNTLWSTRIFILVILELLGIRRKVGDTQTKDKVCPNMLVDTNHLQVPSKEQDLYSAHEVLQLVPLVSKNKMYEIFLEHNCWVKKYLYNAWSKKLSGQVVNKNSKSSFEKRLIELINLIGSFPFYVAEVPAKFFQLWHMRKYRTSEIISDTFIRFHPRDVRVFVRREYLNRLKKYKIPLDSIFFLSLQ